MPRSTRMCESGQVIAIAMILLSASLRFALRASFQLFKITPGDFVAPERRLRTRAMVQGCSLWSKGRNPVSAPAILVRNAG